MPDRPPLEQPRLAGRVVTGGCDCAHGDAQSAAAVASDLQHSRALRQSLALTDYVVPSALSFISGFVDVSCFLGLFQTFVAFITGTLIVLGSELVDAEPGVLTKIVVVAVFLSGAIGWSTLIKRLRHHCRDEVIHYSLLVQAALLALVAIVGTLLSPLPGPGAWQTMLVAGIAAAAMSLQTVIMVLLLGFHPATTVMTLNVTNFIAHALGAKSAPRKAPGFTAGTAGGVQLKRFGFAVTGFLTGVVSGAIGYLAFGFAAIALPVAVLLFLSAWVMRACLTCAMD
jgi:uncharacterized membrane protein YoaK (UPF0700 family)